MQHAGEAVQNAHEFVEGLDWDMLKDAADTAEAAYGYVRRHPWTLLAAGLSLTAVGAWNMFLAPRYNERRERKALAPHRRARNQSDSEPDPLDLMAP